MTILHSLFESKEDQEIEGLSFVPTLGSDALDNADGFPSTVDTGVNTHLHFSQCTREKFDELFAKVKDGCSAVLEIGVWGEPHHPDNAGRSTELIIKAKDKNTIYLGIDIKDRSFIVDEDNNVHFFRCDSMDTEKIHDKIKELGIESFDFIFIDGWHSINAVMHEWENYVIPFLSKNGIVAFHDTNTHPGPYALFECIDSDVFDSEKYCIGNHYGIGAIWYRKED